MRHVLFTVFQTRADADSAIDDLARHGISKESCEIVVHGGPLESTELTISETNAREGFTSGVAVGAAVGLVGGFLVAGPLGFLAIGPLAGALFGAGAGGVYGGLGGAITGAGVPDKHLESLAKLLDGRRVLVTTETEGLEAERKVEEVFLSHGAVGASKANFEVTR